MLRLAVLALAICPSAPAGAIIFDVDDRLTAVTSRDFTPVGIVTGGLNVIYGSGFLIDNCNVLTVRHVAGSVDRAVGQRLHFQSGRYSSDGKVVAAGPRSLGPSESRSIAADWMIIRLRQCLGKKIGYFRLSTVAAAVAGRRDGEIQNAGFPRDRKISGGVTVDPSCRILWSGNGQIAHDCATLSGNSGGPLLSLGRAGWVVIGINAAGWDWGTAVPFDPSKANIAVDVGSLSAEICSLVKVETGDLCAPPSD